MDYCGMAVNDRMHTPIRTMLPGLLLAFSAMSVGAQTKAPEAGSSVDPAATQQSTPIDLSLHPAALPPTVPAASQPMNPAAIPSADPIATRPINPAAMPPANAATTQPIHPPAMPPASGAAMPSPAPGAAPQTNPIILALQAATASEEVKRVVRWVTGSRDNGGLPFLLVDKVNAQVLAFNGAGQFQGAAPAL